MSNYSRTARRRRSRQRRAEEEEDMRYKAEFEVFKKRINSIGERTAMSDEEFDDLFPMMLDSDDSAIADAFENLLFVGKMIFGSELGERSAERERQRRYRVIERERRDEQLEKRDQKVQRIDQISEHIKRRRHNLLLRLQSTKTKYDSLKGKEKKEVDELIVSKHIKRTFFNNLKVNGMKCLEEIPTSNIVKARRETVRGRYVAGNWF